MIPVQNKVNYFGKSQCKDVFYIYILTLRVIGNYHKIFSQQESNTFMFAHNNYIKIMFTKVKHRNFIKNILLFHLGLLLSRFCHEVTSYDVSLLPPTTTPSPKRHIIFSFKYNTFEFCTHSAYVYFCNTLIHNIRWYMCKNYAWWMQTYIHITSFHADLISIYIYK